MGDMSPITATVDNVSHTFTLLEADIPVLTLNGDSNTLDASVSAWMALQRALGNDPTSPENIFRAILSPHVGDAAYGFNFVAAVPTGKAALSKIATALETDWRFYKNEVTAILAMALKGAGVNLTVAAGIADNLSRSSQSSPGKYTYVQSVLTPSILRAAAAA